MSSDETKTPEPANPIAAAVAKKLQQQQQQQQPKKPALEAPFATGTTLRYTGGHRLLAGYQAISILAPGYEVRVADVGGTYSIVELENLGERYLIAISVERANEWVVVEA